MAELEFKIDGPALREGVPIHLVVGALENFQAVLDKTYLVATGGKKITARDREKYFLRASEFRTGSLVTVFEVALQGVQLGLPLVSQLGPQNLWDYTRETFGFLKLVCGAVQRGEKPEYEFNNDGDAIVHVGDVHQHFHGPVIQIGKRALPNYQNLAHLIDPKKLSDISAGSVRSERPDIYIGRDDRGMFDVPTRIEKETIELACEIFDFNKYKNAGKLSVTTDGQPVAPGEYNFTIFGNQDNVNYIYSMLKPEVKLYCLVEMEACPFGDDKVHKLHVTGVAA